MTPAIIDFLIILSLVLFDILALILIFGLFGLLAAAAKAVEAMSETMRDVSETLVNFNHVLAGFGRKSAGAVGIATTLLPLFTWFMQQRKKEQPKYKLIDLIMKYLI
ncbi:MAG: hypothetical protein OHK0017_05140 [Patescibacteria group bacterium]